MGRPFQGHFNMETLLRTLVMKVAICLLVTSQSRAPPMEHGQVIFRDVQVGNSALILQIRPRRVVEILF